MAVKEKMARKRAKARYLVIMKGLAQNEVAKIVGISEKSLSSWSKKYNWHDKQDSEPELTGGASAYVKGFFENLFTENPHILKTIKKLWIGYLQKHEKDLTSKL